MGKVVFWIVIVFAVLMVLRMINLGKQKSGRKAAASPKPAEAEPMVRCTRCGVYMPRSEAMLIGNALRCRDKNCT